MLNNQPTNPHGSVLFEQRCSPNPCWRTHTESDTCTLLIPGIESANKLWCGARERCRWGTHKFDPLKSVYLLCDQQILIFIFYLKAECRHVQITAVMSNLLCWKRFSSFRVCQTNQTVAFCAAFGTTFMTSTCVRSRRLKLQQQEQRTASSASKNVFSRKIEYDLNNQKSENHHVEYRIHCHG